jgi:hypothetical protein
LVFEENVGEDGLSSQLTYKVNIDCPYCKASIAPNQKIVNDLKPSKEQLEKVYGGMMTAVNELRLQIASKKTLSSINCQGKSFNSNIAKVQAQNVACWPLNDIELVDWTTKTNLHNYGFVRMSTTHLFSNCQSKSNSEIYQLELFKLTV